MGLYFERSTLIIYKASYHGPIGFTQALAIWVPDILRECRFKCLGHHAWKIFDKPLKWRSDAFVQGLAFGGHRV